MTNSVLYLLNHCNSIEEGFLQPECDSFDIDTLAGKGYIYSNGYADTVFCCEDAGEVEIEWLNDSKGTMTAWRCCPICGAKKMDQRKIQKWKVNFPVLLERISRGLGLNTPREEIPSVLYYLGTKSGSPIYYLRSIDGCWRRNVEKIVSNPASVILLNHDRQRLFYTDYYDKPVLLLQDFQLEYQGEEVRADRSAFETSLSNLGLIQDLSQPQYRFVKRSGWYIKYETTETFLPGDLKLFTTQMTKLTAALPENKAQSDFWDKIKESGMSAEEKEIAQLNKDLTAVLEAIKTEVANTSKNTPKGEIPQITVSTNELETAYQPELETVSAQSDDAKSLVDKATSGEYTDPEEFTKDSAAVIDNLDKTLEGMNPGPEREKLATAIEALPTQATILKNGKRPRSVTTKRSPNMTALKVISTRRVHRKNSSYLLIPESQRPIATKSESPWTKRRSQATKRKSPKRRKNTTPLNRNMKTPNTNRISIRPPKPPTPMSKQHRPHLRKRITT